MKLVIAKDGYRKVGDKWLLAKKCTKCGKWLVASTDKFHRRKDGRYELASQCKECSHKYNKQWYKSNRNKKLEYQKQWHQDNRDKKLEYDKQWHKANKERDKQYYQDNREKVLERQKQWYQDNKEKRSEYHKQYRQSPQGQVVTFNSRQRRRIKEEQQGTGITKDQWLEMMSFFGWQCAYSGERLTKDNRSVDHIVPIDAGGDNMIWNMVPMTRSLNSSKHANNMEEWYKEQVCYDPKRLAKIYEWQEYAYNKYGKNTEYFNTNDIQIKLI